MQISCAWKWQILFRKTSHSDSTKKFSETDIINMLELLIDSTYVIFGGRVFQQTVGLPMCTNCAPLLVDLFLYSYEADFIRGLLKKNENFTVRYIDDIRLLNNSRFDDFFDPHLSHWAWNKISQKYR
jgi:hypothetical protein